MDRLAKYRQIVRDAMCAIASDVPPQEGIRTELIFDDENGHFEIAEIGWDGPRRIHGSLVHCDILDGKIHVEHDGTDAGLVDMLLSRGISPDEIVIGFHPPELRKLTQFAAV